MTRDEQLELVKWLTGEIREKVCAKIRTKEVPENWGSNELRRYVTDMASTFVSKLEGKEEVLAYLKGVAKHNLLPPYNVSLWSDSRVDNGKERGQ